MVYSIHPFELSLEPLPSGRLTKGPVQIHRGSFSLDQNDVLPTFEGVVGDLELSFCRPGALRAYAPFPTCLFPIVSQDLISDEQGASPDRVRDKYTLVSPTCSPSPPLFTNLNVARWSPLTASTPGSTLSSRCPFLFAAPLFRRFCLLLSDERHRTQANCANQGLTRSPVPAMVRQDLVGRVASDPPGTLHHIGDTSFIATMFASKIAFYFRRQSGSWRNTRYSRQLGRENVEKIFQFVEVWNSSADLQEVASRLGISKREACLKGSYLRRAGVELPVANKKRRYDISALNEVAARAMEVRA